MNQNHTKPVDYLRHGVITLSAALALVMTQAIPASAQEILFSPGQTGGGDVGSFQISPDGTKVAFVGSLDNGPAGQQTYVGGLQFGVANTATRVDPSNSGDVDDGLRWTPDGQSVITRYDVSGNNEFYLVPADGSANTGAALPQQLTYGSANTFDPQVSSDGSRLFYSDGGSLFTTPIAGASPTSAIRLNPGTAAGEISEIDTGGYAQAGSDIIFTGFSTPVPGADNNTRQDTFYRTAADGSTANSPVAISITNFPTDPALNFSDFQITPDGQTIVLRGDLTTNGDTQLYSVPSTGGNIMELFAPPVDGITGQVRTDFDVNPVFTISNDGTMVAFVSDYLTNGVGEAYIVDIGGGIPRRVSDSAGFAGTAQDVAFTAPPRIQFSADDQFLYYVADGGLEGDHDGTFTLHRVSTAATIPEPSSLALLALGGLTLGFRRRRS